MSGSGQPIDECLGLTIRELRPSDAPALSSILTESPGASSWPEASLLESTLSGTGWVAEYEGRVIGFLLGRAAADEFEILNLAVTQECRRRGVATGLLEAMVAWSRTAGTNRAYLEVRASNVGALALYMRHGFTACGRRTAYYQSPREDAILLSWDKIGML